jgi:hypothetical protein
MKWLIVCSGRCSPPLVPWPLLTWKAGNLHPVMNGLWPAVVVGANARRCGGQGAGDTGAMSSCAYVRLGIFPIPEIIQKFFHRQDDHFGDLSPECRVYSVVKWHAK